MPEKVVIGNAELWHGDALEVMAELAPVDTLATDPPYFLPAAHYSVRSGSARSIGDLSILNHYFAAFFKAAGRCLKATGTAYVFCDGQSYPVFYATAYSHFRKLRPLIWDKKTSINGYSWRHQHELILFCEGESAPKVPTGDGDVIEHRSEPIGDREHLAQKPVGLMKRLVEKTTPAGGVVLDPFMGSGTTGVACEQLGRRFVGIEVERRYFDIACERIAAAKNQGELLPPEPTAVAVQQTLELP